MLDARRARRLAQLLGMLGSRFDHEAFSAARKADEMVREAGLVWSDIIAVANADLADHQTMAEWLLQRRNWLDEAETLFVSTIINYRRPLTEKQRAWLEAVHERVRAEAA